jgi:hypothetical protein
VLPSKYSFLRLSLLSCLLGLLTACNNKALEGFVAPDPKLQENSQAANPPENQPQNPAIVNDKNQIQLPEDFPQNFPVYPRSQLLNVDSQSESQQVKTNWSSVDNTQAIAEFYQQQLPSNNWQILQPFSQQANGDRQTLIASNDRTRVAISLLPSTASNNPTIPTEFAIAYQTNLQNSANSSNSSDRQNSTNNNTPTPSLTQPDPAATQQPKTVPTNPTPQPPPVSQTQDRSPSLVEERSPDNYLKDLVALGITSGDRLSPDRTINRREFARWLVTANNKIYANDPGKQIRLANKTSQPVFKDINNNDPDFAIVQGLAEAGLIPSSLNGDNTAVLFRPDAPLTRESLLLWKVPLDNRQALPKASIDNIKETWGFQDANKIDPKVLSALYTDYQNSERSNVRRVFGYTTLFQPKKTVTHTEAATALSYFGDRTEGISLKEAIGNRE